MKKKIVLSVGLATAIFTGCGSSSSGGGDNNTGTGYYIDSAVSGVDYICGTQKGKTGTDGSFTFEKGKDCTFSLGDMKLREVKADTLKDQIKVLEDNLAVATLLQSLDSDGNPDNNGIVISAKVIEELKAKNITKLPTNQDEVAVIYEVIKNVEGYKGSLKSEDDAKGHLDKALGNQLKTLFAGKTLYAVFIGGKDVEKLIFNANATSFTSGSEKTAISFNGNKTIFDDNSYAILREKTADYLLMDDYNADGTKESVTRIYFTKAKAEAYLNSLKNGDTPADTNDLKALLAGKTFWEVDDRTNGKEINKVVFNTDLTSIVVEEVTGDNVGEKETVNITYSNGKMNFSDGGYTQFKTKTADYIDLADSDGDTTRLFFTKAKAEAGQGTSGNQQAS